MPTDQPLLFAADFSVLDATGALVTTGLPYTRVGILLGLAAAEILVTLTVKTGYTDFAKAASVKLNGIEIGTIDPRPWTNHFVIDLETVTFVVPPNQVVSGDPVGHIAV